MAELPQPHFREGKAPKMKNYWRKIDFCAEDRFFSVMLTWSRDADVINEL